MDEGVDEQGLGHADTHGGVVLAVAQSDVRGSYPRVGGGGLEQHGDEIALAERGATASLDEVLRLVGEVALLAVDTLVASAVADVVAVPLDLTLEGVVAFLAEAIALVPHDAERGIGDALRMSSVDGVGGH